MKKTVLTITLFLFSLTSHYAQWEILNEGFKGSINTIDFVNDNVGWIAGGNGTLLKTTDGGENWNSISINESWNINQIDFMTDSIGWAIGSMYDSTGYYSIIKSLDGGYNWLLQKQIQDVWLNEIYAIDENNAYTFGENKIYKTTDGGTNWINISPNLTNWYYNSVYFQNPETGVVVGSYYDGGMNRGIILKTTNAGSTWDQNIVNEFSNISNMQFIDDSTGYFTAHSDAVSFLCKTENMFSSWTVKVQSPYGIGPYQYIDSNTVYAIIADSTYYNNVMKSTDGDIKWQRVQSNNYFLSFVFKIYFFGQNTGFILSSDFGGRGKWAGSALYKSTDGDEWTINKFSYPLNDVFSIDKGRVFIVGGYSMTHAHQGYLYSTDDGGKIWNITQGDYQMIRSIVFLDEYSGFYLKPWEGIYKTTDNGNHWNQVFQNNWDSNGFSFEGNDINFEDVVIGWAVGNYSVTNKSGAGILGTKDGGDHWDLMNEFPSEGSLFSIYFADTTGWAVGDGGLIVKYTPQTGWVRQTSVTDLPLNKVFFADDNHGCIAGGYHNDFGDSVFQSIFLKTTDGGNNWEKVKNVPFLMKDVVFLDNNFGWAVGEDSTYKGVIIETKNGGINWTITVDNLIGSLKSIYIKDNYAWAVGENGLILRTTNAGPTWVEDNNQTLPTEFVLEQNYPNPFNPVTTIRYSVPRNVKGETSNVKLKVYDVLGNEVRTLVNKDKQPGVYEVALNASKLPSGVYLYRLQATPIGGQAGNFNAVKKMLLLK